MAVEKNSFKKEERLCSKKLLASLFQNGSSFLLYPFRVTWQLSAQNSHPFPVQIIIGVPKKRFKRSVDRNLIKRRVKEAYRLSKSSKLYSSLNQQKKQIILGLNYVGKSAHDYDFIEKKLIVMIIELLKQVDK